MPPLSGQVIMTSSWGDMAPALCVTWFWNPNGMLDSRPLRNNPNPWTDPWGNVHAANTGAFIGINLSPQPAILRVSNVLGILQRSIPMPASSVTIRSAADLVLGGLFLDARDFNGASIQTPPQAR